MLNKLSLTTVLIALVFLWAGHGFAGENNNSKKAGSLLIGNSLEKKEKAEAKKISLEIKKINSYSKRAYKAHKNQINTFKKQLKGMNITPMKNLALADYNVGTTLVGFDADGKPVDGAFPPPGADTWLSRYRKLQWFARYNHFADEWANSFNDPYHDPKIMEAYLNLYIAPPPWDECPTYFLKQGFHFLKGGGFSAMSLEGWYCPVESYLHDGKCTPVPSYCINCGY